MTAPPNPFNDVQSVANYVDGPARNVPGWADMIRMTDLLLTERAPDDANVLVVGAGGGLELKHLAQAHSGWRFVGVDPSHEMLKLAHTMLGPLTDRVMLQQGYVDGAPEGPFDAATCLLVLHFVPLNERQRLLVEVKRRLRPGAPFVVVHLSFPQSPAERAAWLGRYAAFIASSGVDLTKARAGAAAVGERLSIVSPQDDERMLMEAGFTGVQLFYAGLAFRGWVGHA